MPQHQEIATGRNGPQPTYSPKIRATYPPSTAENGASQDGRTAQQQPGDLALLDSTRSFELGFDGDFEQLCVTLPVELLVPRLALPQAVTAISIPGRTGLGAMITNQLRFFADNGCDLDTEAARYVAGQLTDVLALALGRTQSS